MKRNSLIAVAMAGLFLAACGGSTSPGIDVLNHDGYVSPDQGGQDNYVAPDEGRVDNAQPDVVVDEGTGTDTTPPPDTLPDNVTDTPVVDTPVQDNPVIDTPVEDNPVVDTPVVDTPVVDTPIVDIPVTDTPVVDVQPEVDLTPECEIDDDCLDFGTTAVCHHYVCDTSVGKCVDAPVDNGTSCTDGEFCTAPDTCQQGVCQPGPAVTCDDGDVCTTDTCTPSGCSNVADTTVLTCGNGACYREIARCSGGVIHTCVAGQPAPETCDGVDNDCDGAVDNSPSGVGANCTSNLQGPCLAGKTQCQDGSLVCVPNVLPIPEKCDGLDNDCDGVADNGEPNAGLPCQTTLQGACSLGETECLKGRIVCNAIVQPTVETCDGVDNDCNGQVDENNPGAGLPCSTGKPGVCGEGVTTCAEGKIACTQTGVPSAEICDGVDNDCDGIADPAGATGCLPFLRDEDADSYGVTDDVQCLCAPAFPYTATRGGDCCDKDDRARPSATTPFPALNNCGSFDFNCDSKLTQQYTYGTGSCGWWPLCSTTSGWLGATPGCGGKGQILTDCNFNGLNCSMVTTDVTQGCF